MAVRRRGITPVVSRYILKSRAHARKSRTKLRARPIEIVEKPLDGRDQRPTSPRPMGVWRDLPLGTVPGPRLCAPVFDGLACATPRQILDTEKYRADAGAVCRSRQRPNAARCLATRTSRSCRLYGAVFHHSFHDRSETILSSAGEITLLFTVMHSDSVQANSCPFSDGGHASQKTT